VATATNPRWVKLGFTDADYVRLLAAQDGHCALCDATPKTKRFHVDHDHRTNKVRGLLCHRCNRVLWPFVTSDYALRLFGYLRDAERA
jgi:hypothetical protein